MTIVEPAPVREHRCWLFEISLNETNRKIRMEYLENRQKIRIFAHHI